MSIGQKIRNLREAHGWKQDDLANETGLNRASIGNYERGDRVPPVDAAKKIADAFNTSVDRLVSNDFGEYLLELVSRENNIESVDDLSKIQDLTDLFVSTDDNNFLTDMARGLNLPTKEQIKDLAFWLTNSTDERAEAIEKMLYYAGHLIDFPSEIEENPDPLDLERLIEQSEIKINSKLLNEKEKRALKSFIEIVKDFRNE